jgi:hypothetical protein
VLRRDGPIRRLLGSRTSRMGHRRGNVDRGRGGRPRQRLPWRAARARRRHAARHERTSARGDGRDPDVRGARLGGVCAAWSRTYAALCPRLRASRSAIAASSAAAS